MLGIAHFMLRALHLRPLQAVFWLLILASVGVKLAAATLLAWEADYVPLIARGAAWLDGGAFPVVGTLSSVAAYNMPFLVWLQLPALALTRHVPSVFIGTQLAFNLLATLMLYRLGRELIDERSGLAAATLFTYSQVGISSAYTAWAQLLLPGFFVFFAYGLFRWKTTGRDGYAALTWLVATAAFMTHFSAVLLYGVLLALWLLLRLPWRPRGLAAGLLLSALMFAPYLAFEVGQDFADLRAFFTRSHRIDAATLAEYAHLKPGGSAGPVADRPAEAESAPVPETPDQPNSRLERGIRYALSLPGHTLSALRLPFDGELRTLRAQLPGLATLAALLQLALEVCFWLGAGMAVYRCGRGWRGFRGIPALLTQSLHGRATLLLLAMLGLIGGLLLVRATPEANASYYTGLLPLQYVLCAYGMRCLAERRRGLMQFCLALAILWASLNSLDRVLRVSLHDDSLYSPQNSSLYRSIDTATDYIATDWGSDAPLTVSYDFLPELAHHWWILPWHTVDPGYRMGMAYDFLLRTYHSLDNLNRDPLGLTTDADYIVTLAPGLNRYDMDAHEKAQFGAIFVLKPLS